MSDRELLEAAAKAAGYEFKIIGDAGNESYMVRPPGDHFFKLPWNPLTDDGDALRLAVKLQMNLCIEQATSGDWWTHAYKGEQGALQVDADGTAATRRAIVRAAAAMAKGGE